MIRAVMYWDRMRLEVTGHAMADEKGKDIICAGASMMVNALVGVLDEMEKRGRGEYKARQNEETGTAIVWANPTMGAVTECKSYFRMAVKGLKMLEQQYPMRVTIKEV